MILRSRSALLRAAGMLAIATPALPPALAQAPAPTPPASPAASPESAPVDEIVVVGSRGRARTDVDRPVPVDVVGAAELRATGQTDLGQQLQFTSP